MENSPDILINNNNKNKSKNNSNNNKNVEIIPLKLGIRCHPPTITLLYQEGQKKRLRTMPVRFLNKFGSVDRVIEDITGHHESFFKKIPKIKVEKMVKILQEVEKGTSVLVASKLIGDQYSVDPNQDLNKLTDDELATKKKVMDQSFDKNQVKEGDVGFEYDIQIDFNKEEKLDAGWDSEHQEEEEKEEEEEEEKEEKEKEFWSSNKT